MARRKSGQAVHGIILLDKRSGVSSNKALQEVKRLFDANKAGHTGSLDPLATGLLPLCFGEATKVSSFMLDDNKCYRVVIQLGVVTETGDREGAVIQTAVVPVLDDQLIRQCLLHFTGEIEQIPPMYSALKHQGKKLYELARKGVTVERKARRITLYKIDLLDKTTDTLTLDVWCSKGTYIRTLAEDIGLYLGCGGTVNELRRLEAGCFKIDDALTIEQLLDLSLDGLRLALVPMDKPLEFMDSVQVSEEQAERLKQGRAVNFDEHRTGKVRIYNLQNFLGLGELSLDGKLAPKKIFNLN
ncbi:tRNA pseudouridine(55) synthase TruB [Methylicorpusculum oleiharenae]|uniref:tRNA pseudouridine(55) synthase TruB n=1 Tax=Methylicorpusculum oleiharenae TaxID=1338687 RepID=UPI001358F440|nr:tRNA pseudouridine(55) synthase TruB [Methylicorpusculum oleiharenae]MCD2452177.1 tRNA pseudouridine(55) synthase TruB [Methylicorpusculum oleiharenae]